MNHFYDSTLSILPIYVNENLPETLTYRTYDHIWSVSDPARITYSKTMETPEQSVNYVQS